MAAAPPGDHAKWVQSPRGAATVSGECSFFLGREPGIWGLTPEPLFLDGTGRLKRRDDPQARIPGAGPSFSLGARHAEKEPPCAPLLPAFYRSYS